MLLNTKNWNILDLEINGENDIVKNISKSSKIMWWILIVLWVIGIVLPPFITIATIVFISYLMILAGLIILYFTFITNKKAYFGYFKWIVLIFAWALLVINQKLWVEVLGIIFIFYFFVDWFINLILANLSWLKNWWWVWLLNSILLFALAIIFIISWWNDLAILIGIFIWISLFFDGLSLLISWKIINKLFKLNA